MRQLALVAVLLAPLFAVPVGAQGGRTPAQDSALRRLQQEATTGVAARAAWIRDLKPCTPPPLVDTTGWQPARLADGAPANALLPPGFEFDATRKFFHGGVQWDLGKQVFARMRGWWGPDGSTACVLPLGGQSYVVSLRSDTAGVSLFAFPADTRWGESEGLYAASANASDLDLLWTIIRFASPVCDRYLLGAGAEAMSPNNPCPGSTHH